MKKIICLTIALCLVFGSFSFAFAAVQDVSDSATHTLLQTIQSAIGGTNGVLSKLQSISSYLYTLSSSVTVGGFSGNQVEWTAKCASILDDIYTLLNGSLASSGGSSIADILSAILAEFTQTTAGGSVMHFFSRIDTNVLSTKNLVNTISSNLTSIGTEILSSFPATVQLLTGIKTNQDNYFPGFGAYLNSIDLTADAIYDQDTDWYTMDQGWYALDQSPGMSVLSGGSAITIRTLNTDGTVRENIVDLSNKNWRDNVAYMLWNNLNTLTRGTGMIAAYYGDTQTRTSWLTNQQQTFTPTSLAKGIYYWLSSIQAPIARLAYVHASDQEIAAREKAASNQAALVTNFVDANGSGSVPTSSFGSLAGLSNSYKTNFSSDVAPTRIFDIFNSERGTWFSQETADQLDTTSSGNRSKSGSSFETPLLDAKINEIYEEIGVKK